MTDNESASAPSQLIAHELQQTMNRLGQNEQLLAGVQEASEDAERTIIGNLDADRSASSAGLTGHQLQDMLDPLNLQGTMDRNSQQEETAAGVQKKLHDSADAMIGKIGAEESEAPAEAGAQSVALHDLPMFEPVQDVGLNPQPEPASTILSPIADVGLNPQPEPPSTPVDMSPPDVSILQSIAEVGLNPQPEPPSEPDYAPLQDISIIDPINMTEQDFIDPSV